MSRQFQWSCVALIATGILLAACKSTYLSEPPAEFYEYIESLPTPSLSVQVAENTQRVTAPRDPCTSFVFVRLYGTNESYASIRQDYEHLLCDFMKICVVRPGRSSEWEYVTFIVSEMANVGLENTTADDPVALMDFEEEVLVEAQASFETLFILSVEHAYNCDPPPYRDILP